MNLLVAIANHGNKNIELAKKLIAEYQSMSFDVDIVLLCEAPKNIGDDITELVGAPTKDPWSLPFSHRKLFAENASKYDLFIYTEDDMLISEANICSFLAASENLPGDLLPGFVRYERHPNNQRNYLDLHGPFHWDTSSVRRFGDYIVANLSNQHSACYMLTKQQLERAIHSGGFLVAPHQGRYDMLCAAATDPYTQCGFSRVICISHIEEFELHHLSNAYLNRLGLSEEEYRIQICALFEISDVKLSNTKLFPTEKKLDTPEWDKSYYEPCSTELLRLIPPIAKNILTVGCGSGNSEVQLIREGKKVQAIPLDLVIGRVAETRGVNIFPPNFESAFQAMKGVSFDAIILLNVLQHLPDPISILRKLELHLSPQGVLVGSVPNLSFTRRMIASRFGRGKFSGLNRHFDSTAIHLTSSKLISKWLKLSGLTELKITFEKNPRLSKIFFLNHRLAQTTVATNIIFVAERSTT